MLTLPTCNSLAIDTQVSRKYLSALTVLNTGEYCGKYYEQNPVDGEPTMFAGMAADKAPHHHHNTMYAVVTQNYYYVEVFILCLVLTGRLWGC